MQNTLVWIRAQIRTAKQCVFFLHLQKIVLRSMEGPFGSGTASIGFQLELERSKSSSQMSQKTPSEYIYKLM